MNHRRPLSLLALVLFATAFARVQAAEPVSFRAQIAPLLRDNCLACHGPKKAEGGYRVDSFERLGKEGDSGAAAVTAKDLEDSELFRRVISEDADERMPLEGDPLPAEQIALLKRWIEEGATFDGKQPQADLAAIIPPPVHPDPPEAYLHPLPVTAMEFAPDGSQLWVGGYHEITVWNPDDGALLKRIKNIGQRTYGLAFHPDGKRVAVSGGTPGRLGEVRILDIASGEVTQTLSTTTDVVLDAVYNPAGDRLATAAADGVIRIYDAASGDLQHTISSHSDWVMAITWSADGKQLASASRDKTSKVFNTENGELVATYSGHGQPVKGVAFHPDGKEVYSGGGDKKLHRWKVADGKKSADVASFGNEIYKLAIRGDFLVAASADKTVRQFETKTHKQVRSYAGMSDWALSSALHPASSKIAGGGFDGTVIVWNAADGKELTRFRAAPGLK